MRPFALTAALLASLTTLESRPAAEAVGVQVRMATSRAGGVGLGQRPEADGVGLEPIDGGSCHRHDLRRRRDGG